MLVCESDCGITTSNVYHACSATVVGMMTLQWCFAVVFRNGDLVMALSQYGYGNVL